jgi:hypothetical protein
MEEAICRRVIVLPSTKAHGSSLDWFCESSMRKAMAACTGSRQSNAALSKGSIGNKNCRSKRLTYFYPGVAQSAKGVSLQALGIIKTGGGSQLPW